MFPCPWGLAQPCPTLRRTRSVRLRRSPDVFAVRRAVPIAGGSRDGTHRTLRPRCRGGPACRRVRGNADFFARDSCEMKSGWAVGAWFVPIGNLWLPAQGRGRGVDAGIDWDSGARRPSHALMNVWWALFVAMWWVGRVANSAYEDAVDVAEMKRAAGMMMFSDVLDAVAALFALLSYGS
ncbi:DUF4328 domain-containing protein [Streptomyces sp. INA 01156]